MNRISRLITSLACAAPMLGSLVAAEGDWPQWGGNPTRNMYNPTAKGVPATFEPGKNFPGKEEIDPATTKGLRWVAKLGSQSFGTPTVSGGRVFVGTNNEAPRDPKFKGDKNCLYCFDEKTGKFLWQLATPKLESGKVNDWEYVGMTCSPTVEGNYVYVVTPRCEVVCLTTKGLAGGNEGFKDEDKYLGGAGAAAVPIKPGPTDADIVWRFDMMDEVGVFHHNAANSSPLIVGDILYVVTSNGQDWSHVNIPAPKAPSIIALDKKTGKFLAEDDLQQGPRIFHGLWSSLSYGGFDGRNLLIYGGGDGVVYGIDPTPTKDGDSAFLKKVWWYDCNPDDRKSRNGKPIKYPAYDGVSELIASPVIYKGKVYAQVGQDPEHGEGVGILHCIDPTKVGDVTKAAKIWSYDAIHRSISTMAIVDDLIYVSDFSGVFHCIDAMTGQAVWTHDLKAHVWSSPLAIDGKVFIGDETGALTCLALGRTKQVLGVTKLPAAIIATPVFANGTLFVTTNTHLYAVATEGTK